MRNDYSAWLELYDHRDTDCGGMPTLIRAPITSMTAERRGRANRSRPNSDGSLLAGTRSAMRGIIVGHEFDQRTRSAARAVSNLKLMRYGVSFTIRDEV